MKGWEGIRKLTWVILAVGVLWGSLLMASWAQAAEPQTQKPWSVGGNDGVFGQYA